ncbi:MAG TPA: helix-turn-helix transcriptional regulator [Jiangellaceae bacterium]
MTSIDPIWNTPAVQRAAADRHFGALIRVARVSRGLTLAEAGKLCGYSASTMSRIETGQRRLTDVTLLGHIARAFDIPTQLFGLMSASQVDAAGVGSRDGQAARLPWVDRVWEDGDSPVRRRELITGMLGVTGAVVLGSAPTGATTNRPGDEIVDALADVLLNQPAQTEPARNIEHLKADLDAARADYEACRYRELARGLPSLVQATTQARDAANVDQKSHAEALLATAYNQVTLLAIKVHENAIAWASIDRALRSARAAGAPLAEAETQRLAAMVLRRCGHRPRAQQLVIEAADRLHATTNTSQLSHNAAYVSLLSTAAYTSAMDNNRTDATDLLDRARDGLDQFHVDRGGQRGTPDVDLTLYQVSCARALGDYGAAIDHASKIHPAKIRVTERRARYWEDVALSFQAWGKHPQAYRALLSAERAAPQEVRYRPWAQTLTAHLVATDRRNTLPGVRNFAARVCAI